MIQINELKIGNLIKRNGIFAKIEVINNELDEVYFMGEDFYYSDFCCNIEPIPLTEEWLLKFGAELLYDNKYDFECYNFGYFELTHKGYCFTFQSQQISEPIKYVHQLQNLYFCLTGAELTVA